MSFNTDGNAASSEEILRLELSARQLILPEPWHICRNYGYESDSESAKVIFRMSEPLLELALPADVSMTFTKQDIDQPVLEVAFDSNDALSAFYTPNTPNATYEAVQVIQALLQTSDLDEAEKKILRKTQDLLFSIAHDITEQQVTVEEVSTQPVRWTVAGYLRALIMERALAVTMVRSSEYATDCGQLYIVEQDFMTKHLDLADTTVIPSLVISLNNESSKTGYYYERRSNGKVLLQAIPYEDIQEAGYEQNEIVAAFMSELYSTVPTSLNVEIVAATIRSVLQSRLS